MGNRCARKGVNVCLSICLLLTNSNRNTDALRLLSAPGYLTSPLPPLELREQGGGGGIDPLVLSLHALRTRYNHYQKPYVTLMPCGC